MKTFANLDKVEAALEEFHPSRLSRFAYTTEHIQQFLDFVGKPQDDPKSIHIAGTSGKTSTAYYSAALLKQAGKRVGLLISPHAEKLNERVQIDMKPLAERTFCDEFAIFLAIVEKSGITLTRAELLYGFAYWEFVRQRVEYIVVEVGVGGLLDATNVITRQDKVCVITDIGMDHTNILGDTLEEITGHKAGIIHLHNRVFCFKQADAIMRVIHAACRQQQADLTILDGGRLRSDIAFLPLFQRRNFMLALTVAAFVLERDDNIPLTDEHIRAAAQTRIPSRMELLEIDGKTIVLDGAHNVQKLGVLAESMRDYFQEKDIALLVAFTGGRGRNVDELASQLSSLRPRHVIVTSVKASTPSDNKYATPEEVAAAFERASLEVEIIPDPARAYQAIVDRPESVGLVTGSIYLLAGLKPLIYTFPAH